MRRGKAVRPEVSLIHRRHPKKFKQLPTTVTSRRLFSPEKMLTLLSLLTPVRTAKRMWASAPLIIE